MINRSLSKVLVKCTIFFSKKGRQVSHESYHPHQNLMFVGETEESRYDSEPTLWWHNIFIANCYECYMGMIKESSV